MRNSSEVAEVLKSVELWSAVMEQAIDDFVRLCTSKVLTVKSKAELWPVRRWLFEEDGFEVGSFMWVCSVLQADPYGLRNRLVNRVKGAT